VDAEGANSTTSSLSPPMRVRTMCRKTNYVYAWRRLRSAGAGEAGLKIEERELIDENEIELEKDDAVQVMNFIEKIKIWTMYRLLLSNLAYGRNRGSAGGGVSTLSGELRPVIVLFRRFSHNLTPPLRDWRGGWGVRSSHPTHRK
jgi:hypothetical protein